MQLPFLEDTIKPLESLSGQVSEYEIAQIILKLKPQKVVTLSVNFSGNRLAYKVYEEVEDRLITFAKSKGVHKVFNEQEAVAFMFKNWPITETLREFCDASLGYSLSKMETSTKFYANFDRLCRLHLMKAFSGPKDTGVK